MVKPSDPQPARSWNWSRLFQPRNQVQHVHAEGHDSTTSEPCEQLQLALRPLAWDPLRFEDLAKKRPVTPITIKGWVGLGYRRCNLADHAMGLRGFYSCLLKEPIASSPNQCIDRVLIESVFLFRRLRCVGCA